MASRPCLCHPTFHFYLPKRRKSPTTLYGLTAKKATTLVLNLLDEEGLRSSMKQCESPAAKLKIRNWKSITQCVNFNFVFLRLRWTSEANSQRCFLKTRYLVNLLRLRISEECAKKTFLCKIWGLHGGDDGVRCFRDSSTPPKHWYLPTSPHGVKTRNNITSG